MHHIMKLVDKFTLTLIAVICMASIVPAQGIYASALHHVTIAAIALLFFMHGAKLSREAIVSGANHWRLHLWVMCSTFVIFPIIGLGLMYWQPINESPEFYLGFLYLCILPATVQSAIAFTSMAGGNVAAAVCSASASSLLGIFITPFLAHHLLDLYSNTEGFDQISAIVMQLLVPFVLGHLSRPWTQKWVDKNRKLISQTDQTSILLVMYAAFSEAVNQGIWQMVGIKTLFNILIVCAAILALILVINIVIARLLGFNKEDEITIVFCGSKKSLANGLPMANILFPASAVGIMVLPLMIFHQMQLMVCAFMAKRYAKHLNS